jgi:ankyrin repeat protein
MVELALAHGADGSMTSRDLDLPMIVYATTASKWSGGPGDAHFDPAKVVTLLIEAGADPHWTSDNGDGTLLHETRLQETHSAEVAKALVAVGVPVSALDWQGRTALFEQRSADMVKVLVAAGAEVNAKDTRGGTPLETVDSEEAALTLLSLGAKPPGEAERLQRLKERAEEKGWMRFLEALR